MQDQYLIARSVTPKVCIDYQKYDTYMKDYCKQREIEQFRNKPLRGSGKVVIDAMRDPLYKAIVNQTKMQIITQQSEYRKTLEQLRIIRNKTQQFLLMLQKNTSIRKRVDDANNQFKVESELLTKLINMRKVLKQKTDLIFSQIQNLRDQLPKNVQQAENLREQYQKALQELKDIQLKRHILKMKKQVLRGKVNDLVDEYNRVMGMNSDVVEQNKLVKTEIDQLLKDIEQIKKDREQAEKTVEKQQQLIQSLEKQSQDLRDKSDDLYLKHQGEMDVLRDLYEQYDKLVEDRSAEQDRLTLIDEERQLYDDIIIELKQQIQKNEDDVNDLIDMMKDAVQKRDSAIEARDAEIQLQKERQTRENELNSDINTKKQLLNDLKAKLDQLQLQYSDLNQKHKDAVQEEKDLQDELDKLKQLQQQQQLQVLDKQKDGGDLQNQLDLLQQQIKDNDDMIAKAGKDLADKQQSIIALTNMNSDLQNQYQQKQQQLDDLLKKKQKLDTDISKHEQDQKKQKADIQVLANTIVDVDAIEGQAIADKDLNEQNLQQILKDIAQQEADIVQLIAKESQLIQELQDATKLKEALEVYAQLQDAKQKYEDNKKILSDLQKKVDDQTDKIKQLGIDPASIIKDPSQISKELAQVKQELADMQLKQKLLQEQKDILDSKDVQDLLQLKGQVNLLKPNIQDLSDDQKAKYDEVGDILKELGIDTMDLNGILKAKQKLQADVQESQDRISLLQQMKDLSDQQQQLVQERSNLLKQKQQEDQALKDLLNIQGIDPMRIRTPQDIIKYIADTQNEIQGLLDQIDELGQQISDAKFRLPQLAKLDASLEQLKKAYQERDRLKKDKDSILQQLAQELQKYDLGIGLPNPNDLKQVTDYIDKLTELQELARIMQLKSELERLKDLVAQLKKAQSYKPDAFKTAIDSYKKGDKTDLDRMVKEVDAMLKERGLSLSTQPQQLVTDVANAEFEVQKLVGQIKYDVESVLSQILQVTNTLQRVIAVLTPIQNKLNIMMDALQKGSMAIHGAHKQTILLLQQGVKDLSLIQQSGVYKDQIQKMLDDLLAVKLDDLDVNGLIAVIKNATQNLTKEAAKGMKLKQAFDGIRQFITQNTQDMDGIATALASLKTQIERSSSSLITAQANSIKQVIASSIQELQQSQDKSLNWFRGNLMSDISFSFIRESSGKRVVFPYKNADDNIPDIQSVSNVIRQIGPYIDAITLPGKSNDFIKKLAIADQKTFRQSRLCQEIDDLILTVWVFDLLYEFTSVVSSNINKSEELLMDLEPQLMQMSLDPSQLQLLTQQRDIIKSIRDQYDKQMNDVFILTQTILVQPGNANIDYPAQIQKIYANLTRIYGKNGGARLDDQFTTGTLQPSDLDYVKSPNELSLLVNAMQQAYATVGILANQGTGVRDQAFDLFMKKMKEVLAPLPHFNVIGVTQAKSLDSFVRNITAQAYLPSSLLYQGLHQVQKNITQQIRTAQNNSRMNTIQTRMTTRPGERAPAPKAKFTNRQKIHNIMIQSIIESKLAPDYI